MLRYNKGEWSEPYCLLKMMADQKLFLCNANLEKTGEYVDVLGGEISDTICYELHEDTINIISGSQSKEYSKKDIEELSERVLREIQKKQSRTFSIAELENFFNDIHVSVLKSKSTKKIDCKISVFDNLVRSKEELGFSIKSFLAGSPTLVNAGMTTNFTYLLGILKKDYSLLKAKSLVKALIVDEVTIDYHNMDNEIYHNNLMLIDTQMPIIISELLKIYYGSKVKFIYEIVDVLRKRNPLKIDDVSIYGKKIKDFLFYSATGMFPNKKWDGMQDVDGGCIIVKNDGNIVTFYIFRKKFLIQFREYLYAQCFLDTASTTRHRFGRIYKESNSHYMKLNLQIRIA